jgi:hypothetical protein
LTIFVAIATLAGMLATAGRSQASPSDALGHVLGEIRFLGSIDFDDLAKWSKNGAPMPANPVFNVERAEADILNLSDGDRNAVLYWLQGHGRSALYAQGATDSDIGPKRDIDGGSAPATPNPWRNIPLATASLEGGSQGPIQILGGFAAVKRDGTAAIACLSFKNTAPKIASHLLVDFPLISGNGESLGTLTLDRSGEFSPNVDIMSFGAMAQWQNPTSGGPVKSYSEGCIQRSLPTAALPFLQAAAAGYHVVRVDFADGTTWPVPSGPPGSPVPAST